MTKGYKRSFVLAAAALMVLVTVLIGTGAPAAASPDGKPAHKKTYTIAFLRPAPDPYYKYGLLGAQRAGALLGANVTDYFSNASASTELSNVENAISKHVDGIMGYAVSLTAESTDIKKAKAAHIPIFLLYGYAKSQISNVAGFEQVDLKGYSRRVGAWLATHVKSGKVAAITGLLGRGDAEGYLAGFEQGLASNPKDRVVQSLPGDWLRPKAFTAAQNIIQAHPDLKGLFVENEDMAIGAVNALKAAGKLKQVTVVSQNGAPYGLAAIRRGDIKASNTDSPSLEAVIGLRVLMGNIKHTIKCCHLYYSITVFVTKKNTNQANPWDPRSGQVRRFLSLPLPKPVSPLP